MSTATPTDLTASPATASTRGVEPALRHARTRLSILATSHAFVDFFAVLMIPLLPVIEGRIGLTETQGAIVLTVGGVAAGVVQPIVAWLSDRLNTRIAGPIGLVVAAVALGSLGLATTFEHLLIIQILAQAGVGAYHPIGASTMGQ